MLPSLMALPPILFAPPPWRNQDIVVYHGTADIYVSALTSGAVSVTKGRPGTDFGPGFYTTTLVRQAHTWAAQISAAKPGTSPAVIAFTLKRDALSGLQGLAFVRGDFYADDFWSLIHYCRGGATDHARSGPSSYYDVVYGPVAAFWNQRMAIVDADQISFHTPAAERVLNLSPGTRII
jgi:hypothetical protein